MADEVHLKALQGGIIPWNDWRLKNPDIVPDFSKAKLINADLRRFDLSGANFTSARLNEADLTGANLRGAILKDALLSKANLNGADLRETNCSGATFFGAKFHDADLRNANFERANMDITQLNRAKLSGVDFSGARFAGVQLPEADFREVNLSGAALSGVNFIDADLSRQNLSASDLSGGDFSGANLTEAVLNKAKLSRTIFHHADLRRAEITDADIRDAVLTDANLMGADLRRSHLSGANLKGADLTGANVEGAYFDGAEISPETKGMEGVSAEQAASIKGADTIPTGSEIKAPPLDQPEAVPDAAQRVSFGYVRSVVGPVHGALQGLSTQTPNDWDARQQALFNDVVLAVNDLYEMLRKINVDEQEIIPDESDLREKINEVLPKLREGSKTLLGNFGSAFGGTIAATLITTGATHWTAFAAGYMAGVLHDKLDPSNPCLPWV